MNQQKKRILTGDRPTGRLHLGHLVGSLQNRVTLQDQYETLVMVADIQALTDNFKDPGRVRTNILEVVADNLAVGLDPEKSFIFIQSQISEIAELTVIFSNLVSVVELQRNPTIKQEIADKGYLFKGGNVTFGFLGYPVSQAADILFSRANLVPVGEDQLPMIELTRRIAKKFNEYYGEVFPLPEGLVSNTPRLMGLDGRKMSKSFDNAIYLADSKDEIASKVMKAKTDTKAEIVYDPEHKPEVSNLMLYYQIATGKSFRAIEAEFAGQTSYKLFKEKLVMALDEFLSPIRTRREYYTQHPELMLKLLIAGHQKASQEAKVTMELVRQAMKINY